MSVQWFTRQADVFRVGMKWRWTSKSKANVRAAADDSHESFMDVLKCIYFDKKKKTEYGNNGVGGCGRKSFPRVYKILSRLDNANFHYTFTFLYQHFSQFKHLASYCAYISFIVKKKKNTCLPQKAKKKKPRTQFYCNARYNWILTKPSHSTAVYVTFTIFLLSENFISCRIRSVADTCVHYVDAIDYNIVHTYSR